MGVSVIRERSKWNRKENYNDYASDELLLDAGEKNKEAKRNI